MTPATGTNLQQSEYKKGEAEKVTFFDLRPYRGSKDREDRRHGKFVEVLTQETATVRFDVVAADFASIENAPFAYQALGLLSDLFRRYPALGKRWADVQGGMNSTESDRFIRQRWEVPTYTPKKWMPFSKGGSFSRFYADIDLVIDWTEGGSEYKQVVKAKYGSASRFVKSESYYGRPGLTWTEMTSKGLNTKKLPEGCIFNCKGPCAFPRNRADAPFLLGVLNSELAHALMKCLTSRSYGSTYVARLPIPEAQQDLRLQIGTIAEKIFEEKREWDDHNEVSSHFSVPWLLRNDLDSPTDTISTRLEKLVGLEDLKSTEIEQLYRDLNYEIYHAYEVSETSRDLISDLVGERPNELIWPQMAGKTVEQKRMEHVWRLLSYAVKRVVEADEDGIVPFLQVSDEIPLLDRVRAELAKLFPDRDVSAVEAEINNELKQKVKGYDRVDNILEWLENVFFAYHASLYKNRPVFWHIASSQGKKPVAFAALVHYHRFDRDRIAKLRGAYLREAIDIFRREAAQASKDGRADDRLEWQARLEEALDFDKRLQRVQEGFHQGAEDYRILIPWKTEQERPKGWDPDIDDGVKVNIEPLQRAGLLRIAEVV